MKIKINQDSDIHGDCTQIKFHLDEDGVNGISGTTSTQTLHDDSNLECNWLIQKASSASNYEHSKRVKQEPNKIHLSFALGTYEDMYITITLPDRLFEKTYQLLKDAFLCNDIEYAMTFVHFEKSDIFSIDEYKNNKVFSGDSYFLLSVGRQVEERWVR